MKPVPSRQPQPTPLRPSFALTWLDFPAERAGQTPERQWASMSGKVKKTPNPSSHLGHLFNAYTRYFNLRMPLYRLAT
ncbi:MAG: hypothetical protein PWQ06_1055 [Anaerophaga sp.]|nr:hypothetical protein [Anaerophaga sp.]